MSSSNLRVLDGGKHAPDKSARLEAAMPPRPASLSKVATAVWEILGPQLVEAGLMTVVDGAAFALHCRNVADMETVLSKLGDVDDWVEKTPNKFTVQSVWWNIRKRLHDDILKTSKEFGMTPASRSSIKAAVADRNQPDLFGSPTGAPDPYAGFEARKS
jgi:P27 family predicted phage terminase small subunit